MCGHDSGEELTEEWGGTACLVIGKRSLEAEEHSRAFALLSLQKLQSKLVAYKHSV